MKIKILATLLSFTIISGCAGGYVRVSTPLPSKRVESNHQVIKNHVVNKKEYQKNNSNSKKQVTKQKENNSNYYCIEPNINCNNQNDKSSSKRR